MKHFKILALAVLFASALSASSNAVIIGVRLIDMGQNLAPAISSDNSGRFGLYVGAGEKNNFFLVGADYSRFKMERGDSLLYSRRLTVNLGYRYMLFPADKMQAMKFIPFLGIHYFKSFSKVEADSGLVSAADVRYFKDMANDSGGWVSIGAEYYFAPVFSMGLETGLRYSRAKSKAYGYEIKRSDINSFVAMLLSFNW